MALKASSTPRAVHLPGAGDVVAGKYRLERLLKQGGMGSVWIATHTGLDERVAVKFMDPRRVSSVEARMRFTREAKAAAQIRSKNIVQILDHGVDGHVPYIAMELLEGEDLGARLRRAGRFSLSEASTLLNDLARAIDRAHAAGIVHRDLKPENIFLAKDGEDEIPKILDFGLAMEIQPDATDDSTSTAEGVLLGTPYFMSPEQVRGRSDIDHRTDLWSLGVIIFRAITGIRPFGRGAPADIIVQICSDPIPRASVVARDLPDEVDRFFETALARDVSKRFSSAKEMAAAFAEIAKLGQSGERTSADLRAAERQSAARPHKKGPPMPVPPSAETTLPAAVDPKISALIDRAFPPREREPAPAPEPPPASDGDTIVEALSAAPPAMVEPILPEPMPVTLPPVLPVRIDPVAPAPQPPRTITPEPPRAAPLPASRPAEPRSMGWVAAALVAIAAVLAIAFRDKIFPPPAPKEPTTAATIVLTAGTVVLLGPGGERPPVTTPATAAPPSSGATSAPPVPSSVEPAVTAAAKTAQPEPVKSAAPRPTSAPSSRPAVTSTPTPKKDDRDLGY